MCFPVQKQLVELTNLAFTGTLFEEGDGHEEIIQKSTAVWSEVVKESKWSQGSLLSPVANVVIYSMSSGIQAPRGPLPSVQEHIAFPSFASQKATKSPVTDAFVINS